VGLRCIRAHATTSANHSALSGPLFVRSLLSGESGNVKHFARITFTLSAALSLLSLATVVGIGVLSYRVEYELQWVRSGRGETLAWTLLVRSGHFSLARHHSVYFFLDDPYPAGRWLVHKQAARPLSLAGYEVNSFGVFKLYRYQDIEGERGLLVPWWSAAMLSAILPAWWLMRYRRCRLARQRATGNLCLRCGYDLRASPERCPECGAVVVKAAT
jgi:hypothetical protein